jgi:hypothetical protein
MPGEQKPEVSNTSELEKGEAKFWARRKAEHRAGGKPWWWLLFLKARDSVVS